MLTDQELQNLRNMGNEAEAAADEIVSLRALLAEACKRAEPAGLGCSEVLGPLPVPEILHELHDAPCPACHTMLRALPPIKMGYTASQMTRYAAEQVAAERDRWERAVAAMAAEAARRMGITRGAVAQALAGCREGIELARVAVGVPDNLHLEA